MRASREIARAPNGQRLALWTALVGSVIVAGCAAPGRSGVPEHTASGLPRVSEPAASAPAKEHSPGDSGNTSPSGNAHPALTAPYSALTNTRWVQTDCPASSSLDVAPQALQRRAPRIKADWFAPNDKRLEMSVILQVGPDNRLQRVGIRPADAHPKVIAALLTSFKSWRFKAGQRDGQPVSACLDQPYEIVIP